MEEMRRWKEGKREIDGKEEGENVNRGEVSLPLPLAHFPCHLSSLCNSIMILLN